MYKPWKSWKLVLGKKTGHSGRSREFESWKEQFWRFWRTLITRSLYIDRDQGQVRELEFSTDRDLSLLLLAISIKSESWKFSKDREPLQFFARDQHKSETEKFSKDRDQLTYWSRSNPNFWISAVRKTTWSRADTSCSRSVSGFLKNPGF